MAHQRGALYDAPSLPSPDPTAGPTNCLQAVLERITPAGPGRGVDGSVVLLHPDLACTCFELLHRLCASPTTRTVALAYVRRRSVRFLPTQVRTLLPNASCTHPPTRHTTSRWGI